MKDGISRTQLTALVWAGTLAPAAELLPAITLPVADRGAWLSPAAAIPLVLAAGWLLGALAGERGLAAGIREGCGPVFGSVILTIYIVWGELLLSLRLRLCAQRLLDSGRRDGALWFFLLGLAILALWMGAGTLPAFGRAGQIFLGVLLAAAGVVLALSLSRVRPERTLTLWSGDVLPVLRSALPAAGVLGWGLFGAFLTGRVQGEGRWRWLFWGLGGCLLLTLAQWITLGSLGAPLAARLETPFFALAKSIGVEGAFQRVESVVAALWAFGDLSLAVLLLFAIREIQRELVPKMKERSTAVFCVCAAVVLALTVFENGAADEWNRTVVPVGNLLLGLAVPLPLCLLRGRGNRGGLSGGEDSGTGTDMG